MKFQDGYINQTPYWGAFEDRTVTQNVISDLQVALGDSNDNPPHDQTGDYVIAFLLKGKLYVSRRNYHALVVDKNGVHHVKKNLESIPIPLRGRNPAGDGGLSADELGCGVLVLSKEYMDDLPKFDTAEHFCRVMSQLPAQQFCIPLDRIKRSVRTS